MTTTGNYQKKDDTLVFATESDSDLLSLQSNHGKKFKLLIVDDEKEVHVMTRLVLSDYSFQDATLEFLSAYSAKEAKILIQEHPDAACILLDVVMEKKDSGLEVTRFIREELKNDKLRIILRTGQPGKAPENKIILNYDINDYKEKTELTTQKLFTTITTALRSYVHLVELEKKTAMIAEKNIQLNDEVARRIVAESNLTKYNRSLEKMIDDKSTRLKTAISALRKKEKELKKSNQLAQIGDISSATMACVDFAGENLKQNLETMNSYRSDMTILLEKYETLQNIITAHADSSDTIYTTTQPAIKEIDQFKKDVRFDEILKKYPKIIQDSTNGISHISKAINDIKRFIAINDEKFKTTDINHLLEKALTHLQPMFSSSIECQTTFEALPIILVAPKNMRKAVQEIIKNSFQALGSKGIISISTDYNDPFIEIHIRDIGEGIAPEHINDIFKPYFTINKIGSSGLGLSFARNVITGHNGTIDVTSVKTEGTHFTIKLPVSPQHN
ncbi:MAG: ATP-binding protein [Pseudomonadota bacterium]